MNTAKCLNQDCDKDEWALRKSPSEYKNGVHCPECGTTRVEVNGESQQQPQQPPQAPAPQQPQQPQAPVQQGTTDEQQLAVAQQSETVGKGLGQAFFALVDGNNDPHTRGQAANAITQVAINFIDTLKSHSQAQQRAEAERASHADLSQVSNLPQCQSEGCGHVFQPNELQNDIAVCPDCGAQYDVSYQ